MRTVLYKDKEIPQDEYEKLISDYSRFIKTNTGITPTFWTVDYDFSDYPTILDTDGDDVMRPNFLQKIADEVKTKYSDYGTDHIITLIHEDNWKSGRTPSRKGIWGTNYSYKYNNFHVQYCRWDKNNLANTFGTINHEQDHTYDALIKVEVGIDINPILGVSKYDAEVTHGGNPNYTYIRYQENAAKLKVIAPYLIAAYAKREEKHREYTKGLQNTVISLLERLVAYYRAKLNQKNGVKK